jgi:hypothetical protein
MSRECEVERMITYGCISEFSALGSGRVQMESGVGLPSIDRRLSWLGFWLPWYVYTIIRGWLIECLLLMDYTSSRVLVYL